MLLIVFKLGLLFMLRKKRDCRRVPKLWGIPNSLCCMVNSSIFTLRCTWAASVITRIAFQWRCCIIPKKGEEGQAWSLPWCYVLENKLRLIGDPWSLLWGCLTRNWSTRGQWGDKCKILYSIWKSSRCKKNAVWTLYKTSVSIWYCNQI